jgi:glycosyltransferase involved in cell wall biosynthesis
MRFLFNTVYYKPARGGGGPVLSVSSLAEALVRRGHNVVVAASDLDIPGRILVECGRDIEIEGVMVRYFSAQRTLLQRTGIPAFAKATVFRFGAEFGAWLDAIGPRCDVIHSHISYLWSNWPCSVYAQRHRKVYLYHQRGNLDPARLKRGRWKKMVYLWLRERPIMRRADALIALTLREVETYRALGLSNRVEVIPNGFDESAVLRPVSAGGRLNALFTALQEAPLLLFLSRIHPVKNPEIFVEAFIQAARANPNIHAMLAGPDEANMVANLLNRVRSAGLIDRFHYVGALYGDEKNAALRRADCFVLPTEAEGFSMALLEALAAECVVLTTKGACFPEIETVGAGKILEPTANDFAQAIQQIIGDGRTAMKLMGAKGRELVRSKYSWDQVAARYEALCLELHVGGKNRG